MPAAKLKHDSWLVDRLYISMFLLARLNLLEIVYWWNPRLRLRFANTDRYVLAHFLSTVLLVALSFLAGSRVWVVCLIAYGGLRSLNILAIQAENLVWFELRPETRAWAWTRLWYRLPAKERPTSIPPIEGPMRSIILLLINYAEIVLWFGLFYFIFGTEFSGDLSRPWAALSLSFYVMSSFGIYPQVTPLTALAWSSAALQALVGLFMTLAVLGRFVTTLRLRFRRPIPDTDRTPAGKRE